MPDIRDVDVAADDNLNPVVTAEIIEHREREKAERDAEDKAAQDAKEAESKKDYEDINGHEPINPLSF